jgi:hypothetical protein
LRGWRGAGEGGRLPSQLGGQGAERSRNVAGQLELGPVVPIDVRADGVDVDEPPAASLVPQTWLVFDRVVADGDDQVSRVQQLVRGLSVEQADPSA